MTKKLDKASQLRRNYALIKNTYQDTKLANKAKHWGDERLYKELGIKVTKSIPKLKQIKPEQQKYYDRKLEKFQYARDIGLEVEDAKRLTRNSNKKIDSTLDYKDVYTKKRTIKNIERRADLWSAWSDKGNKNMPPEIDRLARNINRSTKVRGKTLDDNAHYGYAVAYYMFMEGRTEEDVKKNILRPDPFDEYRVLYREVAPAT